ncbi:hypothetical protein [Bradyrhizobium oligotrophicum]|uniref:hypothetical protein n=1 Tax=Bradyrhizobium oligotrophicum TaxID=44255 RepID=UPI003EBCA500
MVLLLVGREQDIGGCAIGGEGREGPVQLERGAIEVRRLGRSGERQSEAAKFVTGHLDAPLAIVFEGYD